MPIKADVIDSTIIHKVPNFRARLTEYLHESLVYHWETDNPSLHLDSLHIYINPEFDRIELDLISRDGITIEKLKGTVSITEIIYEKITVTVDLNKNNDTRKWQYSFDYSFQEDDLNEHLKLTELAKIGRLRKFSPQDLAVLEYHELDIIEHEIRARHGSYFNDPVYKDYFSSFEWYTDNKIHTPLSFIERSNINYLNLHKYELQEKNKHVNIEDIDSLYQNGRFHVFTRSELSNVEPINLKYLRLLFFAKHGLEFEDKEIAPFFKSIEGCIPMHKDVSGLLNEYEEQNVNLIYSILTKQHYYEEN